MPEAGLVASFVAGQTRSDLPLFCIGRLMSNSQHATKDTNPAGKQYRPEIQPEQPQMVSEMEALGQIAKNFTPADLPNESNAHKLRQARVLQLQRQMGNGYVQRFLNKQDNGSSPKYPQFTRQKTAPEPQAPLPVQEAEVLQRDKGSAGANVEVGSAGVKVELSAKFEKEIPMKYAVATITPKVAAVGELKPTQDPAGSASISKEGAKASVTVYKDEAVAAGSSKFKDMAYQQIADSGWAVDKVDWETELGVGETDSGAGKAGIATGVKFTFKNGHETVVKAQLFEKSAETGLDGPKFTVEPTLKFLDTTLWDNGVAKLTMNGEVKLEMSLKPNWLEIFKELAKSGGRAVARQFAQAAMRGVTNFLLGSGGLIAGGVVTVFSLSMSMIDISEIKQCQKQAPLAVEGYVRGWCISWGIEEFGNAGTESFFNQGLADGKAKLDGAVKKIQQNPVFAPWNFTDDELRPALKAQLRQHGGEVYTQVEAEVKMPIYKDFVLNFYQKQKASIFTPNSIARKNAIWVARGLGFKDPEALIPEED